MLAYNKEIDLSALRFPLLCTPKIDGIRCLVIDGWAVSRTLKPIPNHYIQSIVRNFPNGFDGELVCPGGFQATTSAVMSHEGNGPFAYRVFDFVLSLKAPYGLRVLDLKDWFNSHRLHDSENVGPANIVLPDEVHDVDELLSYEAIALEQGYEGVIMRTPTSPYKCGRSTWREHYMLKLKRFVDSEAIVEGYEELMHNENEPEKNELGLTKRSHALAGQTPGGTLGALLVRDTATSECFAIGSGFTSTQRADIWARREEFLGATLTYKSQPYGVKELPRHPVFKGFRHEEDL